MRSWRADCMVRRERALAVIGQLAGGGEDVALDHDRYLDEIHSS